MFAFQTIKHKIHLFFYKYIQTFFGKNLTLFSSSPFRSEIQLNKK